MEFFLQGYLDRRSLRWPSELESMCTVATGPPPSLGTEAGSRQGKQLDNQVGEREGEGKNSTRERTYAGKVKSFLKCSCGFETIFTGYFGSYCIVIRSV